MKSSSNLEAFLQAATPLLPWRSSTMERFQGAPSSVWQQPDGKNKDAVEYFALSDLWEHYAESSAYGLAVPVRDAGDRSVVTTMHFVPYLSAVQLYTATKPTSHTLGATSRSTGSETDSWSDDSVGDRFASSGSSSWDAASEEDDSSCTYDGNGSAGVSTKQSGYLNFQYREWDSPYERVPLAHKVAELAQDYPCLMSLSSAELSPSSWMSVAWYPIYHIPAHVNLKGTSACFLTYHSISSVFQDNIHSGLVHDEGEIVALSPFGLATYRMQGDLWKRSGSSDHRRLSELHWAAASWLKQVGAHHPDFTFFKSSHR
ncbi:uncharacterized protein LOC119318668 isoform X2 [Triticum dicoccoides]|uniref:uncharacterized protein LOC119318668 isoform X2 n=1 Tax=Triticum dicoccoides TaxID=85692 RepID=UPI001891F321|nr:uncharacterized protein LOC119318668 isoform X2 [Triticum dicoccoides]